MNPPREEWALDTRHIGRRVLVYEQIDSTNNLAAELAHDADLRLAPPRVEAPPAAAAENTPRARGRRVHDRRLPPSGTILRRPYKGLLLQVQVLDDGFAFAGTVYPSLSAVAKAITGSHCNGFLFFRLTTKGASA